MRERGKEGETFVKLRHAARKFHRECYCQISIEDIRPLPVEIWSRAGGGIVVMVHLKRAVYRRALNHALLLFNRSSQRNGLRERVCKYSK